jgi:hypothetical protein
MGIVSGKHRWFAKVILIYKIDGLMQRRGNVEKNQFNRIIC